MLGRTDILEGNEGQKEKNWLRRYSEPVCIFNRKNKLVNILMIEVFILNTFSENSICYRQ